MAKSVYKLKSLKVSAARGDFFVYRNRSVKCLKVLSARKGKMETIISFRMPTEEYTRLEEMARKLGSPLSTVARIVVKRGLKAPAEIHV